MKLEYDRKKGILRAEADGKFDLHEFTDVMQLITSEEEYPADIPTIWDLRNLDFEDFDSQLVKNTTDIRELFSKRKNARIVYVVSDRLGYGMMRMYQALTSTDQDSMVCYDYSEAEAWITDKADEQRQAG